MAVEFQDQQNVQYVSKSKGLENLIISWGLAKDSKGAQMVLLIIAVVAILIGGFFAFTGGGAPSAQEGKPLPFEQIPE